MTYDEYFDHEEKSDEADDEEDKHVLSLSSPRIWDIGYCTIIYGWWAVGSGSVTGDRRGE